MSTGQPDLHGDAEKKALEIEKQRLENEKLALESRILKRNSSRTHYAFETIKGFAVFGSILAAILVYSSSHRQITTQQQQLITQTNEAQANREEERFERAVVRISEDTIEERLAGIAGLSLFLLSSTNEYYRSAAAAHLVDSLAVESAWEVQAAILDALQAGVAPRMEPATSAAGREQLVDSNARLRESVVAAVVGRNRELARSIVADWDPGYGLRAAAADLRAVRVTTPAARAMSMATYLAELEDEGPPFAEPEEGIRVRLLGLARAVEMFISMGAFEFRNFSGIFCERCVFSGSLLDNAVFDGAHLASADFSGANLAGASFAGADVSGAVFFDAILEGANLAGLRLTRALGSGDFSTGLPLFECAELTGADLTGLPVAAIVLKPVIAYGANNLPIATDQLTVEVFFSSMREALLQSARSDSITVVVSAQLNEPATSAYLLLDEEPWNGGSDAAFFLAPFIERHFETLNPIMMDAGNVATAVQRRERAVGTITSYVTLAGISRGVVPGARFRTLARFLEPALSQASYTSVAFINELRTALGIGSGDAATVSDECSIDPTIGGLTLRDSPAAPVPIAAAFAAFQP